MLKPKKGQSLTQKQEQFTLNIFSGMSQREAYVKAGYSCKYDIAILDTNASCLAHSDKILMRLEALRQKAQDATIMDVKERKQRLTEIARAKLTDFMELGADGSWVNIGPETKNGGAIAEIHSRTEYDENGAKPTVHTSVKVHSPTQAIDLLNKMDKLYTENTPIIIDKAVILIKEVEIVRSGDDASDSH